MVSWIAKCEQVWRAEGLAGLCRRVVRHMAETLCQTHAADWYRVDLAPPRAEEPAPAIDGLDIALDATEQAIEWMRSLKEQFGYAHVEQEVAAARRYGHVYALARVEGQPAGYIKIGFEKVYVGDFHRLVHLPAGTAFVYDTFVHPSFRGKRLASRRVAAAMDCAAQRGGRYLWCQIPRWNVRSIRSFVSGGFEPRGHIRNFRLLTWRFSTGSPEKLLAQGLAELSGTSSEN
jgi:GNAT superfamily N-acetyltransferase